MKKGRLLLESLRKAVNFTNSHIIEIIPFSVLFFFAALTYSISWYVLDMFSDIACINGFYLLELLFCNLYLGLLGKHLISVLVSSATIVPFAALVYLTNRTVNNEKKGIVESIRESVPGIIKIISFRVGLATLLFLPLIAFLVLGGDIIVEKITGTGRLSLQKLMVVDLLPIPVFLLLGFSLAALLEPIFQYVEYEVLVVHSRLRTAIRNSYRLAMQYKVETFLAGFSFVALWTGLILLKYLYVVHIWLTIALLAAIFLESFLVFPIRTAFLYFLWKSIKMGYEKSEEEKVGRELKGYTDKMLLG